MLLEKNKSLKKFNTFGFDQKAEFYTEVNTSEDLEAAAAHAREHGLKVLILGGGSNLVLTQDIPGLTIRLTNNKVTYHTEDKKKKTAVVVDAGVNWHQLVLRSTSDSLCGIENLSLIPGTVGAAPVQNIGAYGVELKDSFTQLRALHLASGEWRNFNLKDCNFGYRNSFFKIHPGEYAIYSLTLSLNQEPQFNLSYGALTDELEKLDQPLTAQLIAQTVSTIRQSKLPDPSTIANAGSFFKNPVISGDQYQKLHRLYPEMVSFKQKDGTVKIAAGWLIDSLGFKGANRGGVGVFDKQALVLVNHGTGTADQLLSLASEIKRAVRDRYEISLEIEPQLV